MPLRIQWIGNRWTRFQFDGLGTTPAPIDWSGRGRDSIYWSRSHFRVLGNENGALENDIRRLRNRSGSARFAPEASEAVPRISPAAPSVPRGHHQPRNVLDRHDVRPLRVRPFLRQPSPWSRLRGNGAVRSPAFEEVSSMLQGIAVLALLLDILMSSDVDTGKSIDPNG